MNLWAGLLLIGGLALLILALGPSRIWLQAQTGETAFLPQVKGLTDLAGGLLRPRVQLAPHQVTGHADVPPFGINVFLEQEVEPAKRARVVRMAAEAGFTWLRQEFPWEDIEIHAKGDFEDRRNEPARSAWAKYDHIVALAEQYDIELIVRLSNPPAWSRAQGNDAGPYGPPDDFQDYADFAAAVAERYRGSVRYYQIWNEPNIYPEWGVNPTDPETYTELLKAGATAVRAADPEAVIIAGALAATIDLDGTTIGGRNFSDLLFLQRMYDAGAAPYFDVMGVTRLRPLVGPVRPPHAPAHHQLRAAAVHSRPHGRQRRRAQACLAQRDELERCPRLRRAALRAGQPRGAGRQSAYRLRTHPRRLALAGRRQRLVHETGHRSVGAKLPARGLLPAARARLHTSARLRIDPDLYRRTRRRIANDEDDGAALRPLCRHLHLRSGAGGLSPIPLPRLLLALARRGQRLGAGAARPLPHRR